jgi:uncharacterized delta-60 repeat protein
MLGETQEPILPHPRSAEYLPARKKQIPISIISKATRVPTRLRQTRWSFGLLFLNFATAILAQSQDTFQASVNASGQIYALAQQPDGKILVGGQIYWVDRQPHSGLTRLKPDGTTDPDFHGSADGPGLGNPYVGSLIVQTDGKILVAGVFNTLSGQVRTNIGRLNADGTLDGTFNPGAGQDRLGFGTLLGVQTDGKILAGAFYTDLTGQPSNFLARLNQDGSLDPTFRQPAVGPGQYAHVSSVAFQEDGRMLAGGEFLTLGGSPATNLARLNTDGSLDPTFASPTFDQAISWPYTHADIVAVQADGRILAAGTFLLINGLAQDCFARLNTDGTLDTTFNPLSSPTIGVRQPSTMVLQTDGKIVLGGYYKWIGDGQQYGLARLNPDGSRDDSFDSSVSASWVHALAVQADGRLLVGGDIYRLGGGPQTDVVRLTSTDTATQGLSFDGTAITWLRGGACPEVSRTTFECSTNGLDWLSLGTGQRIPGGWQCRPAACPPKAAVRARGFIQGGEGNRSSWFTETILGRPGITLHPASRTNNAGTTAEFSVLAGGTAPVSYQWLKDGESLANHGNVSGANTPILTLSNVIAGDVAAYSVVVSNADGMVTSAQARLWVVDPAINVQPLSQLAEGGLPLTLSVAAGGTPPLSYQWRKDGTNLAAATNSTLTIAELQWTDRGSYQVVVSNRLGCLTSEVVALTVDMAPPDSFQPTNIVGAVTTLAVQPDGKILVASQWSEISEESRYYFVRLNPDGTADDTFEASLNPDLGAVLSMAVQPDGKILVGGWFSSLGGGTSSNLARLHPDGTLDTTFGLDADSSVNCLISLPDGKIMVGGSFSNLGGLPCGSPARLNSDGNLDPSFQSQADGFFYNQLLGVQPDGQVLVGAQCLHSNGWSYCRLERLQPDGTMDPAFAKPEARKSLSFAEVTEVAVQPDGKLLVSGSFESLAGVACTNFGRLNPDGTFDTTFANPHPMWTYGAAGGLGSFTFQTDGRVLASGYFLSLAGRAWQYVARFEADGSLDETFNPAAAAPPACFAIQPDGKILAGGSFWTIGGVGRWALARLNNTSAALQSLVCDGATITWLRQGSSPEIWSAAFESSNGGADWSSLGTATRIPGGWQLTGLALPTGTAVRARGLLTLSRSSWFVESTATSGPRVRPRILLHRANSGVGPSQFGLSCVGNSREAAVIEWSSDLVNWTALATNGLSATPVYFNDPGSQAATQRFYRVRLWP